MPGTTTQPAEAHEWSSTLQPPKQLLAALGIAPAALKKLDQDARRSFLQLVGEGGERAAIAIECLNAVAASSPGREAEFVGIIGAYRGRLDILQRFLDYMGTRDPFRAAAAAQVTLLPVADLAPARKGTKESTTGKEVTRGISGHLLTDTVYAIYNPQDPAGSVGLFCKDQAALRIFESFAPQAHAVAAGKERLAARERLFAELRAGLGQDALESEPSSDGKQGRSIIFDRTQALFKDLREAIVAYQSQLEVLGFGQHPELAALGAANVRADVGGGLLGWYKRQFEEGAAIPAGLQLAYQRLQDPHLQLSAAEERDYCRALISYQRLHSYLSVGTAVGGALRDLEAWRALSPDDSVRQQSTLLTVEDKLKALLSSGVQEIKVTDFADLIADAGLVQLRTALNRRVWEHYSQELKSALTHFLPLFQEQGRWREDCLGPSVPLERLRQGLYGTKLGVAMEGQTAEFCRSLLSQQEFKAIKTMLSLATLCQENHEHWLSSMPVDDFQRAIERCVVAYRKALYMDQQLAAFAANGEQLPERPLHDALALISRFKPVIPHARGLRPAEQLLLELKDPEGRTWSLAELLQVGREHRFFREAGSVTNTQLALNAALKLFDPEQCALLREYHLHARLCTRATDLDPLQQEARTMIGSPLLRLKDARLHEAGRHQFLTDPELKLLQALVSLVPEFRLLGYGDPEHEALVKRAAPFRYGVFYDGAYGEIRDERGTRRSLVLDKRFFPQLAGALTVDTEYCSYDRPEVLRAAIDLASGEYLPAQNCPAGEIEYLRMLCSFAGAGALRRSGLGVVSDQAFRDARQLRPQQGVFVSKRLLELGKQIAQATP
jgi:hypothetical protein